LPFVGQSLRTEKSVAPKVIPEIKPQPISTAQTQKTPVNFEKPTGNYASPHPSIKELLNPIKVEQINSNLENAPREIFSEDQLKMVWKQYSFIVKEQGLETFYNALIKRRNPIKQSDEVYVISLDNEIQRDYILSHIDPFLLHLRQHLKNYSIKIELQVIEQSEEEKFLTSKQKFELMARKNPNLHVFKSMFNLDIEY
jgi:DNA polymerase-3 subunit gamma/tau